MSSNGFGDNLRITTFGESHGPAVGVVIDGVRPGIAIDLEALQAELDRRRPGQSALSSPRKETDQVEVLAGVFEGKTTGAPIALLVRNQDARSRHYEDLKDLFRPGHADFTWYKKFGIRDWRGGGRTSGRETVSRVAAGAIARQLLEKAGVTITAHVVRIGEVVAETFARETIATNEARCADPQAAEQMAAAVLAARKDGDSLGGIVEVIAEGLPAGWGDPVFEKLDARLAAALMSIGAVKGVEIGAGFALAARRGSASNDPITPAGFASNNMGGLLGGITNGEPLVVRVAVKPTSSIRHVQHTVDIRGNATTVRVPGRHDPCICPRLVPVAEAMVALVLADAYLKQQAITEAASSPEAAAVELAYCDDAILRLVAQRQRLQRQLDPRRGLPRSSPTSADAMLAGAREAAAQTYGIDPALAQALFTVLGGAAGEDEGETR